LPASNAPIVTYTSENPQIPKYNIKVRDIKDKLMLIESKIKTQTKDFWKWMSYRSQVFRMSGSL